MTPAGAVAAFAVAAALLTITPGLDTALVLRTAAVDTRRAAFAAGCGVCAGCLGWAGLVAVGVGALLAASEAAYAALRWVGAAYLVWLGAALLMRRTRPIAAASATAEPPTAGARPLDAFFRGLLTNLLNPKVGVFYVSFLPQFVPEGVAAAPFMLLLGTVHALLGVAWFGLLVAATRAIARLLARPGVAATLDRVTGVAFIAFGVRLAASSGR